MMLNTQDWERITEPLFSIDARGGLPEEVFLAISTLIPIANVDLMILDEVGRILLTRRSDPYFGDGWHIPGGCLRFNETMGDRIQATALVELGVPVAFEPAPIAVREVFIRDRRENLKNQNYRAHHLALLFRCSLPGVFIPDNRDRKETDPGFIKWFAQLPSDLIHVHDVYLDILNKEMSRGVLGE